MSLSPEESKAYWERVRAGTKPASRIYAGQRPYRFVPAPAPVSNEDIFWSLVAIGLFVIVAYWTFGWLTTAVVSEPIRGRVTRVWASRGRYSSSYYVEIARQGFDGRKEKFEDGEPGLLEKGQLVSCTTYGSDLPGITRKLDNCIILEEAPRLEIERPR